MKHHRKLPGELGSSSALLVRDIKHGRRLVMDMTAATFQDMRCTCSLLKVMSAPLKYALWKTPVSPDAARLIAHSQVERTEQDK